MRATPDVADARPAALRRGHLIRGPLPEIAFVVILGIAWVVANPPGYSPDELAHYDKAVAVGHGQWVGRPGAFPVGPGFGPRQLEWINRTARWVRIQAHMAPDGFACSVFRRHESAACLNGWTPPAEPVERLTYVGTYEPFLYLPTGLAINRASDATTGLLVGRAVSGGLTLALLVAAIALLWRRDDGGHPLLGFVCAFTPMVVFLASGLAPSGPELGASVCCTAVVVRLWRGDPATWPVWLAAAAAGTVLALSRSLGPFFVAAQIAMLLVLVGPRAGAMVLRRGGRIAGAAVATIVLAIAANVAWGIAVQPHPRLVPERVVRSVLPAVGDIPRVLRQDVGEFGWADVRMPAVAYIAWAAMLLAVVFLALRFGDRRQRISLAVVVGGCIVGTVAVSAAVIRQTNFPMYGRYVLPLWVTVPLIAGEVVRSKWARLWPEVRRWSLPAVTFSAVAVHFVAFYVNSRHYAVGEDGPLFFLGRAEWSPHGGWTLWLVAVALAGAIVLAHSVVASRTPRGCAAGVDEAGARLGVPAAG